MIILWIVGTFLSWLAIVFVGAPYVPTRSRDLENILKSAELRKGDMIVDLGSGDGRLLLQAARAGYRAVGYELNPFLVMLTWWRLRRHRQLAQVNMADFWHSPLPNDTKAVFVFLAAPFMSRLERRLESEAKRLGHDIVLVSYGFTIPGRSTARADGPFVIYHFKP